MSERDDGGFAFPDPTRARHGNGALGDQGMSLRDWFAGQAMLTLGAFAAGSGDPQQEWVAKHAYALADAMIKARKL